MKTNNMFNLNKGTIVSLSFVSIIAIGITGALLLPNSFANAGTIGCGVRLDAPKSVPYHDSVYLSWDFYLEGAPFDYCQGDQVGGPWHVNNLPQKGFIEVPSYAAQGVVEEYKMTCHSKYIQGGIGCWGMDHKYVTVTASSPTPPERPTVDIKADGSDGPITIDYNSSANLSWTSSHAESCFATGAWSGAKNLSGSEFTNNLTSSCAYTIVCNGDGGTASDSVTVNVGSAPPPPPAPTVDIKANGSDGPITIDYNTSAELTWTSENADACFAYSDWTGDKALNGSESTGNLTSSKTYLISCTGVGGYAQDSVTVQVEQVPAPSVDIKANGSDGPITIGYEESADLSWISSHADSCYATGSWSGDKDLSGSETTGNLTSTQTYTIICSGIGGTASDSVTVNVGSAPPPPPAPTVDIKANGSDGPITIDYNTAAELTWTSENADACFAYSDWTGDKALNGSESTGNLTSSKTYLISCSGASGYAQDSVVVNAGDKPNNPPVADAGPDKETYETESIVLQGSGTDPDGDDVTYSWSCTGGALTSSVIAQPLYHAPSVTEPTTYTCTLLVTDPYGLTDSDSMNVLVLVHESPTLYVSFTVNPNSGCAPLQNVDLSASVYGTATGPMTYFFDCDNDGNWEKVITRNDSQYTAYNLCAYNNPGNYTAKVMIERDLLSVQATVPVIAQNCTSAPTVDIKANGSDGPITIDYDDTANLSWSSSNANSCYAYNAWSGSKSLNGSQTTDHLTAQKTYTITCTGDGGTASDSVTVRVSGEPQEGIMTVEKTARNLTDGGNYTTYVSAEPNDVISFSIVVRAKDAKIYDIVVEDILPDRLVYQPGSLKISGIKSSGNIFTGLNIGDISANKKKTIVYNAYIMGPSNFNYGQTLLKNSVVVTSDDSDVTDSDTVNIMISRIKTITTGTIGTIGTATGISTGITNNILFDSFIIPLLIALTLIWLFKSYVLDAQDWFELRKVRYQEFQAKKLLQLKIAKIRARELIGA